jgi:two-component system cell cycle response regulator CpdR
MVPRLRPAVHLMDAGNRVFTVAPAYGMNKGATEFSMSDTNKIILAEDDNDMRRFLVKALENAGYEVVSFDNGMSAYHRLREEPFELLLTDIVMPEMDGIELARRASELDPDIKKDAKVLSKPFHLRDLVNEVQKMLAA